MAVDILNPSKPGNPSHIQYTANQIAYEATQAGWKGEDVVTATAIALAESGGWVDAYNNNPLTKDLSFGLWQINMYGGMGAPRRAQFGITDNSQLFGSAINAKAAKMIYDGQGWGAWSVYKSGAYRVFLVPARVGAMNPKSTAGISARDQGASVSNPDGGTNTEIDMLKPFKDLIEWGMKAVGPFMLRTAGFIGGGLIVLIALILYVRGQVKK